MVTLEHTMEEISGRLDELNNLLAKPDNYKNGIDIVALIREYNELEKSSEKHNRQREQTAIELETLEESFWQEKIMKTDGI
jgi:hypothetical protein